MQDSPASVDHEREGIILELHGGEDPSEKIKQKAIVEFICSADTATDKKRGETSTNEDEDPPKDGDDMSGEEVGDGHGGTLKYYSWEMEGPVKVLRLQWTTKYACDDAKDSDSGSSSGHWGFFTWLIIM